jgi:hypothetical protein
VKHFTGTDFIVRLANRIAALSASGGKILIVVRRITSKGHEPG